MPRGKPKLNEEQRAAIREAMSERTRPEQEEVSKEEPKEVELFDVAGRFMDIMEKLPDVNHNQRRIAYLAARGKTAPEIAALAGCSAAYVRALRGDPRMKKLVEMFKGGAFLEFAEDLSAQELVERAKIRAAEVLAEKMNYAVDESNQVRCAIELLRLGGEYDGHDAQTTHVVIEQRVMDVYEKATNIVEATVVE